MSKTNDLDALAKLFNTDKGRHWHNYTPIYEKLFNSRKTVAFSLIEIGVGGSSYAGSPGASLKMWSEYFQNCNLHGIDIDRTCLAVESDNIMIHIGDQEDKDFLDKVLDCLTSPLEIIIDDGSHINTKTINTFQTLFPHLEPGGIYVIEDTHCSYEEKFENDRKVFDSFLLKIMRSIDTGGLKLTEHNMQDFNKISTKTLSELNYLERWIEKMTYHKGLCIIHKRGNY